MSNMVNAKGETSWINLCGDQGWNEVSQIIHLEGFIRDKGLFAEFAAYAQAAANEENGCTLDV